MRFLELRIQNFLCFGSLQVVKLANRGLVAILGDNRDAKTADSNGAGKSNIMEAIFWALYGETMRGFKSDEVVNKHVGKDCLVALDVEDDSGVIWTVTRERKKSKSKNQNVLSLVNSAGVTPVTQGITSDTQEMINTLIGMDQDTFVQSVLMCYGSQPFSELTDAKQKEALEAVLQIEQYAHARDIVSKRIKDRQNQLASVNSEVSILDTQLTQVTARLQNLVTSRDEHTVVVKQRKKSLLQRKAVCETQIEEKAHSEGLDKMIDAMKDTDERVSSYRTDEDEINRKIRVASQLSNQKRTELLQKKAVLASQRHSYSQDCTTYNSLVGKPCPTCKRDIDYSEAQAFLEVWDGEIKNRDESISILLTDLSKIEDLEHRTIKTLEANRQLLRTESSTLQAQQRILHTKIQERSSALNLICQLEQQVYNLTEEIEQLENEHNPYASLVGEAENEKKTLESRNQRLKYKQRALDVEIKHLLFWEHGFGNQGIKSFVIEGVLPFLNERAQHYADILSDGDLEIEFAAQRQLKTGNLKEEFQVRVRNRQGAESYKGNSDGEKRRINTAIGWAFGDLAATRAKKPIRFKGLDEVFENLDETGCDLVLKLLYRVLPQYETIFCITHDDSFRSQFPNVLTVIKDGGFSRVEG